MIRATLTTAPPNSKPTFTPSRCALCAALYCVPFSVRSSVDFNTALASRLRAAPYACKALSVPPCRTKSPSFSRLNLGTTPVIPTQLCPEKTCLSIPNWRIGVVVEMPYFTGSPLILTLRNSPMSKKLPRPTFPAPKLMSTARKEGSAFPFT
jgi:hypothetical protein